MLPLYFKHERLSSFCQQLQSYGFQTTKVPASVIDYGVFTFSHDGYGGSDPKVDFGDWIHSMREKLPERALKSAGENSPKTEVQELHESVEGFNMELDRLSTELMQVWS